MGIVKLIAVIAALIIVPGSIPTLIAFIVKKVLDKQKSK